MCFFFRKPKLSTDEFNECLQYLEKYYQLFEFQDVFAEIYNEKLTHYGTTIDNNAHSMREVLKVSRQLKEVAHIIRKRSEHLMPVPESLGALHFACKVLFFEYAAWTDATYAVYQVMADGKPPFTERVQSLFYKQEQAEKELSKVEKKALQLLVDNGLTPSEIQGLQERASKAIKEELDTVGITEICTNG